MRFIHHPKPGSPPRVRGASEFAVPREPAVRITRAYGEQVNLPSHVNQPSGSPPRVRGSRSSPLRRPQPGSDHPRECGEHPNTMLIACATSGLPPRVRGAPTRLYERLGCRADHPRAYGEHPQAGSAILRALRITPAYAGEEGDCSTAPHVRDRITPGVCGEHSQTGRLLVSTSGSPPRVRGAREENGGHPHRLRITPARTGSTLHDLRSTQIT